VSNIMQFFKKLISRPRSPPAPQLSSSDFAVAIDTLTAITIAHHRLIGLVAGHLLALTPPERRRDLINALYTRAPQEGAPNLKCGLTGRTFEEIGHEADDIATELIDALALAAEDEARDPRG
jgi:hypothetical protein